MRVSISLAFCLLVLKGFAATADSLPLEGTYWRLTFLKGSELAAGAEHLAQRPHIALHREANRVAGFGGCNRFFAQYELSEAKISFRILGGGRASCPDSNELEADFFRLLSSATSFEIKEDQLMLNESGELSLRFVAVNAR